MKESNLGKLLEHCKCGVYITVNKHRNYYQTAKESLCELDKRDEEILSELPEEIRKKMIEENTIINIHFYPNTPIGFYDIYHYDIDMALDKALDCIKKIERR